MELDLPDGINTIDQVLLCLVDSIDPERLVGYFWYRQSLETHMAFTMDFSIFPAYQGQGFGKQALIALEQELKRQGFQQMKLRVAPDNKRARHVYEATGFQVTGINMSKLLA
ncbi:GNAT family N-acetyltransferase [Ochrobactrum vermis]|uniref:GNAT family N-acetyltransferase n=1 Tax=Ochrobactrum vermis TaxID=1827297 RepID=A0ABU8PFZ0_9HYPH|nr:GNAT family N-acetyltransferase [Ochrobactrum vermis]